MKVNVIILLVSSIIFYFFVSRYILSIYNAGHIEPIEHTEPFTSGINSFYNKNKRGIRNNFTTIFNTIKKKMPKFR